MRNLRWYIVVLLMLATTINYLDRQALAVAFPYFRDKFNMSSEDYSYIVAAFTWAYGLTHPISGRIIDWLRPRASYAIFIVWWSLASIAHAFAGGVKSFAVMRFFLGIGESGNFPCAAKTVSEWFPAKERTLATGIYNMGSGLGAIIAPPLVGFYLIPKYGWQSAFIVTGVLGFLWLIPWLLLYHAPEKHPKITQEELSYIKAGQEQTAPVEAGEKPEKVSWKEALSYRELWVLMAARFLSDPVWWFYITWIPDYLSKARGFNLKEIGMFAWIPFVAADIGSAVGGALSASLAKRGMPVLAARKWAMVISALMMPVAIPAVYSQSWQLAIIFICIAAYGHQSWAASLLTLPADLFPKRIVASTFGIAAMTGIIGCTLFTLLVGQLVDKVGYVPIFIIAGIMHPIAAAIVVLFIKRKNAAAG